MGGGQRRSSGSGRRPSTGTSTRSLAAAQKGQQAQETAAALSAILDLHRPAFEPASPPVAPPPPAPDAAAIAARHREQALAGIGLLARSARAQARAAADQAAAAEVAAIERTDRRLHAEYQQYLDRAWRLLLDNDPDVVIETLAEAFEDNEAAAAPVGVRDGEASVVVLVPPATAVPERRPTLTAAGNLSLKKLTKRETADFYKLMVCGYVLTTVREALAVAPGLTHVPAVAIRDGGQDAYGKTRVQAVLAARFPRTALDGVAWQTADAHVVLNETNDDIRVRFTSSSKELAPLDLSAEPEIAALLDAVDYDDLAG